MTGWRWRSPGGGDNLYLASIVAVNAETGEYVWHYQTVPGEEWDYTATQAMILADLTIAGRKRQVLMQAPKNGFFYVLDRATGELISANQYVPINWATGIDMKTGRPIENPAVRYGKVPTLLFVRSHISASEGTPWAEKCRLPEMIASTITEGPAILAQVTLSSPSPRAAACFSMRPMLSMAISGMKMAPNC